MDETSKYLIHADVTADGVVERSDVVGAIFGQTEGLLGDELDLRDLRQSQKVGRIDVEVASAHGTSEGHLTIATSLDKVETATLAASLETIDRVGPCRADIVVTGIEDVRAAKRKAVVERATELVRTGFDDAVMSSEEILAEVRQHVRVEDITEYEGLPAGPHVLDSDAIIVVEGRSDVLTLLQYGIKNAVAVEGTNVPAAVAELTRERTTTAFFDGDRGGELILEELTQVGEVDYVAFAPPGSSVEDLDHNQLFTALQEKVPYESVAEVNRPREAIAATDGSATPAPPVSEPTATESSSEPALDAPVAESAANSQSASKGALAESPTAGSETTVPEPIEDADSSSPDDAPSSGDPRSQTIYEHARAIIDEDTDRVRFLDADGRVLAEASAGEAYGALEDLEDPPSVIVLDAILGQRLLDLAADRDVDRIIATSLGQFTKRPTGVRIHAADEIADPRDVD